MKKLVVFDLDGTLAEWDPDFSKRKRMKAILDPLLPEFSVHLGGALSIGIKDPHETKRVIEAIVACLE